MVCCKETGTALAITHHCVPCVFRNRLVCFHTKIWRLTTCSLLGALTCVTFILFHGYMEVLMQWLTDTNDFKCFLLFIALFTVFSLPFVLPGYIFLNMAAGFRFGFIIGTTVVVISVGIGSTLAFLICKSLLSSWMTSRIPQTNYFQAIIQVVEGEHAFRVIAVTRLTPIPFGIQNGVFAISRIPTKTFILASAVGSFPNQVLNAYMGSTMHSLAGFSHQPWSLESAIVVMAQVCFSFSLSIYVVRKAQGHLQETINAHTCTSFKSLEEGRTIPKTPPNFSELSQIAEDISPGTPSKQAFTSWCNFGCKVDNQVDTTSMLIIPI